MQSGLIEQKLSILAKQLTDSEVDVMAAKSKFETIKKASIENFPEKLLTPNLMSLSLKLLGLE
jgi:hypothetical protein